MKPKLDLIHCFRLRPDRSRPPGRRLALSAHYDSQQLAATLAAQNTVIQQAGDREKQRDTQLASALCRHPIPKALRANPAASRPTTSHSSPRSPSPSHHQHSQSLHPAPTRRNSFNHRLHPAARSRPALRRPARLPRHLRPIRLPPNWDLSDEKTRSAAPPSTRTRHRHRRRPRRHILHAPEALRQMVRHRPGHRRRRSSRSASLTPSAHTSTNIIDHNTKIARKTKLQKENRSKRSSHQAFHQPLNSPQGAPTSGSTDFSLWPSISS